MNVPGPIKVAWADHSRRELLLAVRPFHEYADVPRSVLDMWWLTDPEKDRLKTTHPIPAAFIIAVGADGKARGRVLEGLLPEEMPLRLALESLAPGKAELASKLTGILTREGLTAEEASGLVATWEKEFLDMPGLRVITVLPQWIYNAVLPAEVFPLPDRFVRVGLVWRECEAELPVGVEALGILKRRWEPVTWPLAPTSHEIVREPLPAGPKQALARGDGGEVLHGPGKPGHPALSADGSRLAFAVLDGSRSRLLLADLEAGVLEEVLHRDTPGKKHPWDITLSADGRRIAFHPSHPETTVACVADLATGTLFHLPSEGFPLISGNGRKVLLKEHLSLRLLDLETHQLVTVFEDDIEGLLIAADLTADGKKVAFAFEAGPDREVYLVDLEMQTIWNASQDPGADDFPRLSADGSRLFFESTRTRDSDIFLADLEARTLVNLTARPGEDRFALPVGDGRRFLYREWETGYLTFDLETGAKKLLPDTWRVWTVSADGRKGALIRWRGESPYLCVVDLDW